MKKFFSFFKPLLVTLFLVVFVEYFQLQYNASYMHDHLGALNTLKVSAAALVLLIPFVLLFAFSFTIKEKILKSITGGSFGLRGFNEVLCTAIILLAYIPAFIVFVITKRFTSTMEGFWQGHNSLIPIVIILLVIIVRVVFKERFIKEFATGVRWLWKPTLALTIAAIVWIAVVAATGGKSEKSEQAALVGGGEKPNVILITFDGMSARDMSLYGYPLKTTPFMEELALESFVFNNAHSNYTSTVGSVNSLLTGKYPWTHNANITGEFIAKEKRAENIATLLPDYYTAAISASKGSYLPLLGFGDQFDQARWSNLTFHPVAEWIDNLFTSFIHTKNLHFTIPFLRHFTYTDKVDIDAETFDYATSLFGNHGDKPLFYWVHIWPPHVPYNPPPPYSFTFLPDMKFSPYTKEAYEPELQPKVDKTRLIYDEYVLFADAAFKGFIGRLKIAGYYDNSIIIIFSDHGENFIKGWMGHGSPSLNVAETHVPLMIHMPGQKKGARIEAKAELVDLAPTILDLLSRPLPGWMDGESLLPYMAGKENASQKTKFAMTFYPLFNDDGREEVRTIAAIKGEYRLVMDMITGKTRLYNLSKDPDETYDLSKSEPEITAELAGEITRNYGRSKMGSSSGD